MRILVVGAGATGGYIGAKLLASGRDVTFLVRAARCAQLRDRELLIRTAHGDTHSMGVCALTRVELHEQYDLIILTVRAAAVDQAIEDMAPAVGATTAIVPLVNGMAHLGALVDRFGSQRVLGAAAKVAVSLRDGVIIEVLPDVTIQIGALNGAADAALDSVADALSVDGMTATISDDIVDVMWWKFAFITSTAALTCLMRHVIGPIAQTPNGPEVARRILSEVVQIAAAQGHQLSGIVQAQLLAILTDPESRFAPSMLRDMLAGLPVETEVLGELSHHAHRHDVKAPLLNAALTAIQLHNQAVAPGSSQPR